jgi:hypothetical protein
MRRAPGILVAAAATFLVGGILVVRFLYYFFRDPTRSGHIQSLTLGVASVIVSVLVCAFAVLADLLSVNRRLLEEMRDRVGRLDTDDEGRSPGARESRDESSHVGNNATGNNNTPSGRLLRGPRHADARSRDSTADRKAR